MKTQSQTKKFYTKPQIVLGILLLGVAGGIAARLLWTNKNDHDPGTTILEGLTYTISDLTGGAHNDGSKYIRSGANIDDEI